MEVHNLFSIPVYKFKFGNHLIHKEKMMNYLNNDEVYRENTREKRKSLCFTRPNLQNIPEFKEFKSFAQLSLQIAMRDLGFVPSIQITGMWATKHHNGGSHHTHQHGNSFLTGVYYLHGNENHAGTTFHNVHRNHKQIVPEMIPGATLRHVDTVQTTFKEGTLFLFPSWLVHGTDTNNTEQTNDTRHILSFNGMPLGASAHDEFEKFDYQDMEKSTAIIPEIVKDLKKAKNWVKIR
jgi:uncharacterized protein (TIGR02466 family)